MPIVEVAPGRWKRVDRCSGRDRVAAALILVSVDEAVCEVEALLADLKAILGDEVVLPDWASPELVDVFDTGWQGPMPSIVTVRKVRDELRRWRNDLLATERKAA